MKVDVSSLNSKKTVGFVASKNTACKELVVGTFYPKGYVELRKAVRNEASRLVVKAEQGNSGSPIFCDDQAIGILSTTTGSGDSASTISYVSAESIYEVLKIHQLEWLMANFTVIGTGSDVENVAGYYERASDPSEATHVLLLREKPFNDLFKPLVNRLYLRLVESAPKGDEEGRVWLASANKKKSERSNGVTARFNYEMKFGYKYENQEVHFVVKLVGTKNGEPYSKEESLPMRLGETQTYQISSETVDVTLKELGGSDM